MDNHLSEIERAIQNDLTSEDRATLARVRDLHRGKLNGHDLDDWLAIGTAHNIHIRLALRLARTNERKGRPYTKYLSQIMMHDGIDDRDKKLKSILTALAFICDEMNPERLEVLAKARAEMTPGELAKLNSPHTARTLIKRLLAKKLGYEPGPKPASKLAKLAEVNAELRHTIEHLEEQLASKDGANTVFTPKDTAKDIVATIGASISRERLREIEKEIPVWLKAHPVQNSKPPKR